MYSYIRFTINKIRFHQSVDYYPSKSSKFAKFSQNACIVVYNSRIYIFEYLQRLSKILQKPYFHYFWSISKIWKIIIHRFLVSIDSHPSIIIDSFLLTLIYKPFMNHTSIRLVSPHHQTIGCMLSSTLRFSHHYLHLFASLITIFISSLLSSLIPIILRCIILMLSCFRSLIILTQSLVLLFVMTLISRFVDTYLLIS